MTVGEGEAKLQIRLDRSGILIDALEDWSQDEGYWEASDGWEATILTETLKPSQLGLQPVTLILDGVPWVTGRIEIVTSDDNPRAIKISGRDYLSELAESHVKASLKVSANTTLAEAVLAAVEPHGIDTVIASGDWPLRKVRTGGLVGQQARKDLASVKLDALQPRDGQSVFDFCSRLAARCGCTIQPGEARNVLAMSVPAYQSEPIYSLRRLRDRAEAQSNNIVSATATRNMTHLPTVLRLTGGVSADGVSAPPVPTGPGGPLADPQTVRASYKRVSRVYSTDEVVGIFNESLARELNGRITLDFRARGPIADLMLYRPFRQEDSEIRTEEQLHALACRIMGERLKATLVYTATVRGFRAPNGRLWTADTIADVRDEIADVNEPMWIESVSRSFSRGSGAVTRLTCIRPGVAIVEEPT